MKITISDKAEAVGYLAATRLLEEISVFELSESKNKFVVGLSSGRTMDRVYNWFVEIIKEKKEKGENLPNFSNIQFVQTEAFYPEDPNDEKGLMAKQIQEKFVKPLKAITDQEISIYYPGQAENIQQMESEFTKLTRDMDIDFVTLHESGAAKGLRDADIVDERQGAQWAQSRMQTRRIQKRSLEKIRAGEEMVTPKIIRMKDEKALSDVMASITEEFSENKDVQTPEYFITEGYYAYKNAKKLLMISEGENKSIAIKRVLTNIRIDGMSLDEQAEISRRRRQNLEGTVSGSTIIDLRRGKDTEILIDFSAATQIDEQELRAIGIEISNISWDNIEHSRELGSQFLWGKII